MTEVARFSTHDDARDRYALRDGVVSVGGRALAVQEEAAGYLETLERRGSRWFLSGWAGDPRSGRVP